MKITENAHELIGEQAGQYEKPVLIVFERVYQG